MNILFFLFYIIFSGICISATQVTPEEKLQLASKALTRVPGFNMFTPCPELEDVYKRDMAYLKEQIKMRPSAEWGVKQLTDIDQMMREEIGLSTLSFSDLLGASYMADQVFSLTTLKDDPAVDARGREYLVVQEPDLFSTRNLFDLYLSSKEKAKAAVSTMNPALVDEMPELLRPLTAYGLAIPYFSKTGFVKIQDIAAGITIGSLEGPKSVHWIGINTNPTTLIHGDTSLAIYSFWHDGEHTKHHYGYLLPLQEGLPPYRTRQEMEIAHSLVQSIRDYDDFDTPVEYWTWAIYTIFHELKINPFQRVKAHEKYFPFKERIENYIKDHTKNFDKYFKDIEEEARHLKLITSTPTTELARLRQVTSVHNTLLFALETIASSWASDYEKKRQALFQRPA